MIAIRKPHSRHRNAPEQQFALRRAEIRSSWSPSERDERARQATLQLLNLWAIVNPAAAGENC